MGEGFTMLQYSIYGRWCPSEEAALTYRRKIRAILPPKGQVRVLSVTDRQFGKMEVFAARSRERPEKKPEQLLLL
jgi:CRISPR-associated protein Cas2